MPEEIRQDLGFCGRGLQIIEAVTGEGIGVVMADPDNKGASYGQVETLSWGRVWEGVGDAGFAVGLLGVGGQWVVMRALSGRVVGVGGVMGIVVSS